MQGKLICVLLLATAMLVHDIPRLKRAHSRDRIVYGVMALPLLYLAYLFVAAKTSWPNIDTVFNWLHAPASAFIHWLNPAQP